MAQNVTPEIVQFSQEFVRNNEGALKAWATDRSAPAQKLYTLQGLIYKHSSPEDRKQFGLTPPQAEGEVGPGETIIIIIVVIIVIVLGLVALGPKPSDTKV